MNNLTGKTRFTARGSILTRPKLILQVEYKTPSGIPGSWNYKWRNARLEDMPLGLPNIKNT